MKSYYLIFNEQRCIELSVPVLRMRRQSPFSLQASAKSDRHHLIHIVQGQLMIPDTCVSRHHATLLKLESGEYSIQDMNSRSGTLLNGIQIREQSPLIDGDRIKIGQTRIEFRILNFRDLERRWPSDDSDFVTRGPDRVDVSNELESGKTI